MTDGMTLSTTDKIALAVIESRIDAILPETYQESYDDVQPTAMGSAALRFDREGRVAWNEIWTSFCDLAMAGGPPHKGRSWSQALQRKSMRSRQNIAKL